MTFDDEVKSLIEKHTELCARAHGLGLTIPDDLAQEFDAPEAGRAICASLEKLVRDAKPLAEDAEREQDAPAPKKKTTKAKRVAAPVAAEQQESDKMATKTKTTAKKVAAKKKATTKAKGTKKVAAAKKKATTKAKGTKKVAAAKKAATKAKGTKVARADSKTAWVVGKLRNGGVTRAQILAHTGWKAVSVQQLAEKAGIKLKMTDERPFKYSAAK